MLSAPTCNIQLKVECQGGTELKRSNKLVILYFMPDVLFLFCSTIKLQRL